MKNQLNIISRLGPTRCTLMLFGIVRMRIDEIETNSLVFASNGWGPTGYATADPASRVRFDRLCPGMVMLHGANASKD